MYMINANDTSCCLGSEDQCAAYRLSWASLQRTITIEHNTCRHNQLPDVVWYVCVYVCVLFSCVSVIWEYTVERSTIIGMLIVLTVQIPRVSRSLSHTRRQQTLRTSLYLWLCLSDWVCPYLVLSAETSRVSWGNCFRAKAHLLAVKCAAHSCAHDQFIEVGAICCAQVRRHFAYTMCTLGDHLRYRIVSPLAVPPHTWYGLVLYAHHIRLHIMFHDDDAQAAPSENGPIHTKTRSADCEMAAATSCHDGTGDDVGRRWSARCSLTRWCATCVF